MRISLHYLFSITALILYGGQVCPFVDSLSIFNWALSLIVIFALILVIRRSFLSFFIDKIPYENQVSRQFILELGCFILAGTIIAVFNILAHGFPAGSGMKIVIGCISLGFFTAADMSLAREKEIYKKLAKAGRHLSLDGKIFPLSGRFALVASFCLLFMTIVLFLVISRDLILWLATIEPEGLSDARKAVLMELAFIGSAFLLETVNLIVSFSRNLKIFFKNENDALFAVAEGRLNSRATVSALNEFGLMAHYTNDMIGKLKSRTEELQLTQDVTICTLASLAETRDNETGAHILRTQRYVKALAEYLREKPRFESEFDDRTIDLLFKSAPLHDIGKVGVRDAVLLKPGKLTDEEFKEMKMHPSYGRDSLRLAKEKLGGSSFLRLAEEIAYTHHEKWDGSGYPQGLKGDEIPFSGRLMALADVYDALISERIYKKALSHEEAKEIIITTKGTHFDPLVVEAFLEVEEIFKEIAHNFADGKRQIPAQ